MEISTRRLDGITVFDVAGDLILEQSQPPLRSWVHDELENGAKGFAINLQNVHYIDSYGAGSLLAAHTTALNAGTRCNFYGASPRLIAILTVVRLIKVLSFFPDEASALANLAG